MPSYRSHGIAFERYMIGFLSDDSPYREASVDVLVSVMELGLRAGSDADVESARSKMLHACGTFLLALKNGGEADIQRNMPECFRILSSRAGASLHQFNVAREVAPVARELVCERIPTTPAPAPSSPAPTQKSKRGPKSSRRPVDLV